MLVENIDQLVELKHLLDSLLEAESIERWTRENSGAFFNAAAEALNADELSFSLNMMKKLDLSLPWSKPEKRKQEISTYTWKKNNKVRGFQGRNVIEMRTYYVTEDDKLISDSCKQLELRFFFGMLRYVLRNDEFYYPAEYNCARFNDDRDKVRFLRKDEIPGFYTRFMRLMASLAGKEEEKA